MNMSRVTRPVLLAMLLLAVGTLTAQEKPKTTAKSYSLGSAIPLNPDVRTGVLPNGLTYFILKNAKPEQRAELRLAVNAGSVRETD